MVKLLVWGTGKLANQFLRNGYKGELLGFVETEKSSESYMDKPVYEIEELPENYDYIIVANAYTTEIYRLCLKSGVDISKMIFLYSVWESVGCKEKSILKDILQEKNYDLYCGEFRLTEESFIEMDLEAYQRLNRRPNFAIQRQCMYPVLTDKYASAGTTGNYFWQDLWAARLILKAGTKKHFDIGSRLDGFIAHLLAAEIEVTIIDIREFPEKIKNLYTIVDDATTLYQIPDESIESMSALCSLEHFGLGRYGDPIDPEACFKCFENIQKKLKKGGRLYISVPVGKERVEFNAHRVFYASTIIECFKDLKLMEFSCISQGGMESMKDVHKYDDDLHNGEFRYGLFYFIK